MNDDLAASAEAGLQQQNSGAKPKRVRGRPFPKGRSGNPSGRRRGSVSVSAALKRKLTRLDADAIALKVIEQAKGGDAKAQRLLLDRIDGPLPFRGEFSGPGGTPLLDATAKPPFDWQAYRELCATMFQHGEAQPAATVEPPAPHDPPSPGSSPEQPRIVAQTARSGGNGSSRLTGF